MGSEDEDEQGMKVGRSRSGGGGGRPTFRSRSSHQGDHSTYGYEDDYGRERSRRARSARRRDDGREKMKSRRSSPSPSGVKKLAHVFSDTKGGLGAAAVGGVAGAFLAYRAARSKEKSGEGANTDPLLIGLLGAVAGGVSANVVERYVEHGKENGSVRDKWGEEVGTSRKEWKGKVRQMTRGGDRSRSLNRNRGGRSRGDDDG